MWTLRQDYASIPLSSGCSIFAGPRAGGHLDLPAVDKELRETANPLTECDCVRSYGRS